MSLEKSPPAYGVEIVIGAILSITSYGVIIALAVSCIKVLKSSPYLAIWRRVSLIFSLISAYFLTITLIQFETLKILDKIGIFELPERLPQFSTRGLGLQLWLAVATSIPALPMAIWGTDPKSVVRYAFNFKEEAKLRRYALLGLVIVLKCISTVFLITMVLVIAINASCIIKQPEELPNPLIGQNLLLIFTVFNVANVALGSFIGIRLRWHQNRERETSGALDSPYTRLILSVGLESCALAMIGNTTSIMMVMLRSRGYFVLRGFMIQLSVLATLLLIYRMAKGTDAIPTVKTVTQVCESQVPSIPGPKTNPPYEGYLMARELIKKGQIESAEGDIHSTNAKVELSENPEMSLPADVGEGKLVDVESVA